MGSGSVPRLVSALLIILSVVLVMRAIGRLRIAAAPTAAAAFSVRTSGALGAKLQAAMLFALLLLYAFSIRIGLWFPISTTAFLLGAIMTLARARRDVIVKASLFSILAAFGLNYVFTGIFVVDLP